MYYECWGWETMSKINSFRVVNLNYNNNAIRIEDEKFLFDGDSTLLSLQNGGGKSVLVQMMLAPFVRKRYRDTADRPFASYFTTNKPTFLLVEWKLDGGAGFVLTGMMVRQRQNTNELGDVDELEMINFIHEYKVENSFDIDQIPIIEIEGKVRKLKSFNACRAMFEERKKARGYEFQYYDMTQSNQQRQYFIKLKEYGINHEEWETIIKKINVKESGLSELFKDAKDEAGLVEKWFLPAVESKLNQDENRIKQFQSILLKYIRQYRENQSKIERKETILKFQQDAFLIREENKVYVEISEKGDLQKEKLAYIRKCLESFIEKSEIEMNESSNRLRTLEDRKNQISYEEISYELYQIMDALDSYYESYRKAEENAEFLKEEIASILHKLHVQECAKLYQDYLHETKEVLEIENRLDIIKKDDKELQPERDNIGYNLKLYYEKAYSKQCNLVELTKEQQKLREEELLTCKKNLEEERAQFNSLIKEQGKYQERIKQFDQKEAEFNNRYAMNLERNILGTYDEGTLDVIDKEYNLKLSSMSSQNRTFGQRKLQLQQQLDSNDSKMQSLNNELGQLTAASEEKEIRYNEIVKQLEERTVKMRYLNLPVEMQWDTEKIIAAFDRHIDSIQLVYREFEHQLDELNEEQQKLKSGEVLRLPTEFQDLMEEIGLHYVLGMDWLRRNGYSEEENRRIVEKNPMIPYSIIISSQELNRLIEKEVDFYTSYPIPIIVREDLEKDASVVSHGVYQMEGLSLFVVFNHHLLNEEALQALLKEKEEEINRCEEKCLRKKEELEHYRNLRNDIYYQNLNKETYDELMLAREDIKLRLLDLKDSIVKLRESKVAAEHEVKNLDEKMSSITQEENRIKDMLQALNSIKKDYETCLEQKTYLDSLNKKLTKSEGQIVQLNRLQEKLTEDLSELCLKFKEEQAKVIELQDKCTKFKIYQSGSIIEKDSEDLEARFDAITKDISSNLAELETLLKKANDRLTKAQNRLLRMTAKYNLVETEFNQVIPDDYIVHTLEHSQGQKEELLTKQRKELSGLDRDIAVKENEKKRLSNSIYDKFEGREPCRREQIIDTEFKKRMKLIHMEIDREKELYQQCLDLYNSYRANLAAMSEFTEFTTTQVFSFEEELASYKVNDLGQLNSKMLEQFRGEQIRDYRKFMNQRNSCKQSLSRLIDKILRKEEFKDDFFHKPLETMLELLDSPNIILEQLDIILQSYQALLEKLEVDIAVVEKEKQKVLDILLDYIEEIHKNLGKIDKNSSIVVKERTIKMLKLSLPNWDEQLSIYKLRLKDYLEELTKRGLERLSQNGNIEELIGTAATTKNLYDSIVGIGSIAIRLYKIEAQREYPITWAQVSKNSGGEGFLSAFAVLSCLLSYMRRDDTDLFTEREEGKVLVMDNPFAQTNASHLLIPMMDIAKKCNTQLICLSGLGGESIYNRFDNIYVLNLVGSGLQKDIQYLTAEQVKGDAKIYNITTSRVQVETMEQMELLF